MKNREDAALKLLELMPLQKMKEEHWKIIGISKGGLFIADRIAKKVSADIDFLLSQAIYSPNNDECEIARVSETEEIVINEKLVQSFEIQYDYIYGEAHRKHEEEILSHVYKYRKGRPFVNVEEEVVLLVDEGSETGARFLSALKTILSMKPKAVYIAVAVIPTDVLELLEPFADDVYFVANINDFVETSLYYKNFDAIDDETVEKLLEENR